MHCEPSLQTVLNKLVPKGTADLTTVTVGSYGRRPLAEGDNNMVCQPTPEMKLL